METIRAEFTSNISHELKTPLTSIRGYIELLESGALYDEKNNLRILAIMHKNVSHIISLVGDLLHLSSIESNEDNLMFEALNWTPIIEEVTNRSRPNIDKKKLTLEVNYQTLAPVIGNRKAMTHILENLLQNAISYTPDGGRLLINTYTKLDKIFLDVKDSGIGIPQKDLERIFERFYRVDTARSRDNGGTGLGLSIVKHLVAQLHGNIYVQSTIGEGSTFTIELPPAV